MKWDLMTSAFPRNKRTTAFYTSPRHFWVSMWLLLTLQDFVHQMGSTQNYYSKWRIYYRCAQISSVNTKWKSEVYCIHTLNAYYRVFVVHFPSTDFLWISHLITLGFIWTFGLNNRRLTGTICTRCALSRLFSLWRNRNCWQWGILQTDHTSLVWERVTANCHNRKQCVLVVCRQDSNVSLLRWLTTTFWWWLCHLMLFATQQKRAKRNGGERREREWKG